MPENKKEIILRLDDDLYEVLDDFVCKRFPSVEVLATHCLQIGVREYLKAYLFLSGEVCEEVSSDV